MSKSNVIGRWKTRGGKYWLELIENADSSYSYRHENGGGYMGLISESDAWRRMAAELESYAADGHKLWGGPGYERA